jgi:hypothetical protein
MKPRVTDDTNEGPEILASEITKVATAARALLSSRLTKKAILLLIKDASGVPQGQVALVLEAAAELDKRYTKR